MSNPLTHFVTVSTIENVWLRRLAIVVLYMPMAAINIVFAVAAAGKWSAQLIYGQHQSAKSVWSRK